MESLGVVMGAFELKIFVSEAKCTYRSFWTIPDSISDHIKSQSMEIVRNTRL